MNIFIGHQSKSELLTNFSWGWVILFSCLLCQVGYCQVAVTGKEERITLKDFRFRHPMSVISSEEVAIVKDRIKKRVEPQATAFKQLLTEADRQLDFVADPPESMDIMGGYEKNSNLAENRAWLWRNCHAAYTLALAYTYTGNPKYAKKGVEVLNSWARKGTVFTGQDRGLQLGSHFTPMLYAADLLRSYQGWEQPDRIRFKQWWIENCLVHTADVMRTRSNNWKDHGVLGVMVAAVVFEDTALLEESLNQLLGYYKSNPDRRVARFGTAWKMSKDQRGTYLTAEVTRNGGRSGLTYTFYSLTSGVECLEIARYVGYDFWSAMTPQGANFQGAIEQLFKWSRQGEAFPWNAAPDNKQSSPFNMFEIANNHCTLPGPMKEWLIKNRPIFGVTGDEYVTLNKADVSSLHESGK